MLTESLVHKGARVSFHSQWSNLHEGEQLKKKIGKSQRRDDSDDGDDDDDDHM